MAPEAWDFAVARQLEAQVRRPRLRTRRTAKPSNRRFTTQPTDITRMASPPVVFDGHAGGWGDPARLVDLPATQHLSPHTERHQSRTGSAHLFVTPRMPFCIVSAWPSRGTGSFPRDRTTCGRLGMTPLLAHGQPTYDTLAEMSDGETLTTTMTCPTLWRLGTPLRLGSVVQIAVVLRSHGLAVPSCPRSVLGSDLRRFVGGRGARVLRYWRHPWSWNGATAMSGTCLFLMMLAPSRHESVWRIYLQRNLDKGLR